MFLYGLSGGFRSDSMFCIGKFLLPRSIAMKDHGMYEDLEVDEYPEHWSKKGEVIRPPNL